MSQRFHCRGLTAGYGSMATVRDFHLDVNAGSIVAILGPNGAGKSTLLLTMAGLLPRLDGDVLVDGHALSSGRPGAARAAGVVLVPDDRSLFPSLTARDNIETARRRHDPPARSVIELFPALECRWSVAAGALSGGEQQMLAIARAVIQRPRVLLIDEMTMGLAPVVAESLLPLMRRIAVSTEAVVILVEQHVHLALGVADQALVLTHGDIVLRGPAAAIAADPDRLEAAYLGAGASVISRG